MPIPAKLVPVVVACAASLCSAQSQAYHFNAQASPGDKYGWSVAAAGDTDGDGHPDILVGAPFDDTNGTSAGAAYLYSGRTGALLHAWYGENPNDLFGSSVDGLGDIDGDGRSDVVIGAPLFDFNTTTHESGCIYLYSGFSGSWRGSVLGTQTLGQLGSVVRGLGDVDGDGDGDFAVSTPYYDTAQATDAGRVQMFSTHPLTSLSVVTGSGQDDLFGSSIEPLVITGNPLSCRVAIGAPRAGTIQQGSVRIFDCQGIAHVTLYGTSQDGWFGAAVARVGDIDGDGSPEFAVGEPYSDFNGTDSGRVLVYTLPGVVKYGVNGGLAGERFGERLATLGDYDGDGRPDFLVGAPALDLIGMPDAGRVMVLSGDTGAQLAFWSGQTNDSFGRGLASAGDLNLDGTADILIGAPSNTFGNGDVWSYLSRAPLPSPYCVAKLNSLGCAPQIAFTGCASLSIADHFHVRAQTVLNNKTGLAIWSHSSASTPFNGAVLCVQAPVIRTPGQSSGGSTSGSDCTGTYDFHFSQVYMLGKGVVAGDTLFAQVWSRDQGFAPPQNFGLTDALRFDVVP